MDSTFATNLIRLRRLNGYTMEELANSVNCSKQAISNYENGNRFPDGSILISLSKVFGVQIDDFFKRCQAKFSLIDVNYREGLSLKHLEREQIEEKTSTILNDYLELEEIAKDYVQFQNPLEELEVNNISDAEKAAKLLRKKWKLGEGPIGNISNFLEKKGIRVLKIDFASNHSHEGLSGWADNKTIPVIVLNNRPQDICRVRFTILHELGHLLLQIKDGLAIEIIENICNAFAGAVLLPADVLIQEFGKNRTRISMDELKAIKELYGVSIAAIMYKAKLIGLINTTAYENWRNSDLSFHDYGHYNGQEEPQKFLQMLYKCLSEKKIGFDKAAQLYNVNEEKFRKTYNEQLEFSL